jgi:hypothetical protein
MVELRAREHVARQRANGLRWQVFGEADPARSGDLLDALTGAEAALSEAEHRRMRAESAPEPAAEPRRTYLVRGPRTTGLDVSVALRMAHVPTSIYHLFDAADNPLVSCTVRNASGQPRRLRVTVFVDGYSARCVRTVELGAGATATQDHLPTLYPDRLRELHELSAATVNVMVEDLDGAVEQHSTVPVALLARTTSPLAVRDPSTGRWCDLTRYFGAFVTPNVPAVMSFLRDVADHHPDKHLAGYQGSPRDVTPQVEAVFLALRAAGITYVNSVIAFSPDDGTASQRVRLPRHSLADRQANCIDGTVLVASLLEAMSMNPAIVVVPGHALVGWETWSGSGTWDYLETTMIGGTANFAQACASARRTAHRYEKLSRDLDDPSRFRRWPLKTLRATHHITPME